MGQLAKSRLPGK